jgi:hypothetical protein
MPTWDEEQGDGGEDGALDMCRGRRGVNILLFGTEE